MIAVPVFSVLAIAVPGVSPGHTRAVESTQQRPSVARLTLRGLVTPAPRVEVQGRLVRFALHAHIRCDTLDAVALFMLLNSPNIEVLGLTIVPGNSWMENGTAAALRQLELG